MDATTSTGGKAATPPEGMHSVALVQGAYYAATGIWPWVSMRTFLRVTGPKTDLWLVRTVGALVGVIGGALAVAGARRRVTPELRLLGAGSAAALAAIDTLYVLRGRIPPVYLADAAAELALVAAWAGSDAADPVPRVGNRQGAG